jgi:hypothetical protein
MVSNTRVTVDFNQDTILRLLRLVPDIKRLFIRQKHTDIIICTKEYFPNINIFYEMEK